MEVVPDLGVVLALEVVPAPEVVPPALLVQVHQVLAVEVLTQMLSSNRCHNSPNKT